MKKTKQKVRNHTKGITLLPAILGFLSVSIILVGIQSRELGLMRLQSRLIEIQRETMDQRALNALLTPALAQSMTGLTNSYPLDGTPFVFTFDTRKWTVRLNDVEGLADLYLASPAVLAAAGLDPRTVEQTRQRLLNSPTGRLASLSQSFAAFSVPADKAHLFTQSATNGHLRQETAARELKNVAQRQTPAQQNSGQTILVQVTLAPVGTP
jgi:hypothetical protein